ncbi:hypothetical protein DRE_03826 [Drechslerella stenobrocha 248]|uniref:Zinc/iron permease n=1 Tax=Drechslerella stenobrocha 248 TaxID=1043628 RepID=W7HUB9_9PEZI|nr:hypothetical protein DRE_03826 [Drechslerella stenobrocha 248]
MMMMEDRDARAWMLTACSALACCAGASVILIDLLPWKHFSIQSNSSFLAACLSLSFSVLSFSSARLFGEAVAYLTRGYGNNPYYIIMVSFSAGFLVCYYLFKFLHRFIPHRTVNCDDDSENDEGSHDKLHRNGYQSGSSEATLPGNGSSHRALATPKVAPDEETALLSNGHRNGINGRPTFAKRISDTVGKITKRCTEDGRCLGFITCPCEGSCMHPKGGLQRSLHSCQPNHCSRQNSANHCSCGDDCHLGTNAFLRPVGEVSILEDEEHDSHERDHDLDHHHHRHNYGHDHDHGADSHSDAYSLTHEDSNGNPHKNSHHHHVANNAFVGIGFQTSLAIALHRLPDGFIMFVTNHADKQLGFTIFLSLFIHSAVDGFTMCLPLYLALQSGWKAVTITFVIGGLAQPLGGLIAFIWLKFGSAPSETVYGIIFSFTAGLMAVVAVQLLRQIPSDHKHPDLPYISMLVGGVLMCLSVALTT